MIENYELMRLSASLFLGMAMGILAVKVTTSNTIQSSNNDEVIVYLDELKEVVQDFRNETDAIAKEMATINLKEEQKKKEEQKAKRAKQDEENRKYKELEEENGAKKKIDDLRNLK